MWKISKMLAIISVIAMGGFIGFVNTNNQNLNATQTMIRWVDVPMTDVSLPNCINIDLQKDLVSFNGNTENATVRIEKETVEVPKYIVKEVVKTEYERNFKWENKLLDKVAPLQLPKINVDRN